MKKPKINLWVILLATYLIQSILEWLREQNAVSSVSKAYLSQVAVFELICAFLVAVALERAVELYRKSKKVDKEALEKSRFSRMQLQEKYKTESSKEV